MAIGNVTPDSFYAASRLTNEEVVEWARQSLEQGADILDIGACSTRPNSVPVDEEEEWRRLEPALRVLKEVFPNAGLSVDTFRPKIARRVLEQFGPVIINDISGGCEAMYDLVLQHDVPYVFTFRGAYQKLSILDNTQSWKWILDPGLGFCGGVEADYTCLRRIDELKAYNRPVLVGVSRKSMIYKPLGLTPETCLNATQALQMYALEHGATILRTHDVAATRQTIKLFELCNS